MKRDANILRVRRRLNAAFVFIFLLSAANPTNATNHASATNATTVQNDPLRNHYNDPFAQITNAIAACPTPRGPLMTEREAKADAHQRIERGNTCFNAGKCASPNAYIDDQAIAKRASDAMKRAIKVSPGLAKSSVWITVQRRFIFAQGCVASSADRNAWERVLKGVTGVDYVGVDVYVGALKSNQRMPYPTL